jgi:hypothetical protein
MMMMVRMMIKSRWNVVIIKGDVNGWRKVRICDDIRVIDSKIYLMCDINDRNSW